MDILLVEDDDRLRDVMHASLIQQGFGVTQSASGEEALARPGQAVPAAVVTDVDLADGMDGFAFARAARLRWPQIRVLYVSGEISNMNGRTLPPGDVFMAKPFSLHDLAVALRRLLATPELRAF
jgi:DNA-binding response OmpR family regulator